MPRCVLPRDDTFHLHQMLEVAQVSRFFVENRDRTELDSDLETISKPEVPLSAVPEQCAGQLDQAYIVGHLLVVAHQDRPALG